MIIRDGRILRGFCNKHGFKYHKTYKYILTGYNPKFAEIVNGKPLTYKGGVYKPVYLNLCGKYYPFVEKIEGGQS